MVTAITERPGVDELNAYTSLISASGRAEGDVSPGASRWSAALAKPPAAMPAINTPDPAMIVAIFKRLGLFVLPEVRCVFIIPFASSRPIRAGRG